MKVCISDSAQSYMQELPGSLGYGPDISENCGGFIRQVESSEGLWYSLRKTENAQSIQGRMRGRSCR